MRRRDFNETRPHTSLGFMTPADEVLDRSFWPVAELEQGHSAINTSRLAPEMSDVANAHCGQTYRWQSAIYFSYALAR